VFVIAGSGRLEFNEFRDFYKEYKKKHKNSPQAIENAFKMFDKDGNGYIEARELKCKSAIATRHT